MTSHQPRHARYYATPRAKLQALIPPSFRESWYRFAVGAVVLLYGLGLLGQEAVTVWIQLVGGTVTLIFALIYATSPLRVALYAIVAPVGAVLLYYGVVGDARWAILTASVAQAFGLATAAAKTVQGPAAISDATV